MFGGLHGVLGWPAAVRGDDPVHPGPGPAGGERGEQHRIGGPGHGWPAAVRDEVRAPVGGDSGGERKVVGPHERVAIKAGSTRPGGTRRASPSRCRPGSASGSGRTTTRSPDPRPAAEPARPGPRLVPVVVIHARHEVTDRPGQRHIAGRCATELHPERVVADPGIVGSRSRTVGRGPSPGPATPNPSPAEAPGRPGNATTPRCWSALWAWVGVRTKPTAPGHCCHEPPGGPATGARRHVRLSGRPLPATCS